MPEVNCGDRDQPTSLGMLIEFWLLAILQIATLLLAVWALVYPEDAQAHPGRLAAHDCHNGGRHCHGGSAA